MCRIGFGQVPEADRRLCEERYDGPGISLPPHLKDRPLPEHLARVDLTAARLDVGLGSAASTRT
jgi:hypothetical protein